MTPIRHGFYWTDDAPQAVAVPVMRVPWALRVALLLGVVVWLLALVGVRSLLSQVSAVVPLHGRDAEVNVANPTPKPLRVTLALYRDVALKDSMAARISPSAFTLEPGAQQMVRLRLPGAPKPGSVLRLATTFTPVEEEAATRPTMRFVLATRVVIRVEAGP